MDEPTAWLNQARADRQAAERLIASEDGSGTCHAIAQWQQTVEKAVKALVAALHVAGILNTNFRPRHEVEPYIAILVRLPRSLGNRSIQQQLHGLLDQNTRVRIRSLDRLTPSFPPRRNTEYPFRTAQDEWTYPAATGTFSAAEVRQFRDLAHRILDGAERVVSALLRRPKS